MPFLILIVPTGIVAVRAMEFLILEVRVQDVSLEVAPLHRVHHRGVAPIPAALYGGGRLRPGVVSADYMSPKVIREPHKGAARVLAGGQNWRSDEIAEFVPMSQECVWVCGVGVSGARG